MDSAKIAYERIDGHENIIRIPLANIKDSQFLIEVLQDTFDACFKMGETKFIVDLENMQYPPSKLIALLVEVTSHARRLNGDVKIVNLSNSSKNNLATFSPLNYLSVEHDEQVAVQDFQKQPKAMPTVDIVEDPIIERLQNSFEKPEVKKEVKPEFKEEEKRKGEKNHLRVKSITKNLYTICDFVTNYAERAGFGSKEIGKTKIAVYEACLNVIEHAYYSNPDNWIDVWIEYNSEMFKVIIQDYGHGFEGFSDKRYDVLSAMDGRQTGGFGLYIIRRSMDELEYRPDANRGNRLTMIKYIPSDAK